MNDFLEVLYYLKNINLLKLEENNFYLNADEIKLLSDLSNKVEDSTLLTYWQFTINTIEELDMVSNQNIAVEMFLIRLLYLKEIKQNKKNEIINKNNDINIKKNEEDDFNLNLNNKKSINQIKNYSQEQKLDLEKKIIDDNSSNKIESFDKLIKICNDNKEINLKYELETNVNLVRFDNQLIEISFNENLDKSFVKNLSEKLYKWTSKRWIITFSKQKGMMTKKQNIKEKKDNLLLNVKKGNTYKRILEIFPGSELINVEDEKKND